MQRIQVTITLSADSIARIRATPELQQQEMDFIRRWKQEGLLEHFYISADKTGAVLLFQHIDEAKARELIGTLPYFPFMSSVSYLALDMQF